MRLCDVTPLRYLPRGVRQIFTYSIPAALQSIAQPGSLVNVVFQKRQTRGVILKTYDGSEPTAIDVHAVRSMLPYPPLTNSQLRIITHLAEHYGITLTLAAKTVIPTLVVRPTNDPVQPKYVFKRQLLSPKEEHSLRSLLRGAKIITLTGRLWDPRTPFFGEYLRRRLGSDGQGLCLFPDGESLMAAFTAYSAPRAPVALWQSDLNMTERSRIWLNAATGRSRLVLGTRSAIFLPFKNLKTIIIFDANADGHRSWDQQPHYAADALAMFRAKIEDCHLLIAQLNTPLVISGQHLRQSVALPSLSVIDRRNLTPEERRSPLPPAVAMALHSLSTNARCLFFVNRRGYGIITCRACGEVARCSHCQLAFTYTNEKEIHCNRCNTSTPSPTVCPYCHAPTLQINGLGIDRVVAWLRQSYPDRSIVLLAADDKNTTKTDAFADRMRVVERDSSALVIATTAILSRLWFLPRFDLTVVLRAEQLLTVNDWRANERALHTLTTLRAVGRKFIVDTSLPNHSIMTALQNANEDLFRQQEIADRRRLSYPPFVRLIKLTAPHRTPRLDVNKLAASIERQIDASAIPGRISIIVKLKPNMPISELYKLVEPRWRIDVDPDII